MCVCVTGENLRDRTGVVPTIIYLYSEVRPSKLTKRSETKSKIPLLAVDCWVVECETSSVSLCSKGVSVSSNRDDLPCLLRRLNDKEGRINIS